MFLRYPSILYIGRNTVGLRKIIYQSCECVTKRNTARNVSSFKFPTKENDGVNTLLRVINSNDNSQIYSNFSVVSTDDNRESEDLLEKMFASLSTDIHTKNRVYKNDMLKIINKIKDLNFSTTRQSLLLLHCCAEFLPDETTATRMNLANEIWSTIKPHTKFITEHYNELLRCYIANNKSITIGTFIQQMEPMKPNRTTYELFLQMLGEAGDLNQAAEVLSNMKSQGLPATENIFNSLIIGQGKVGTMKNIQEIQIMMKSLKIKESINTYTSICRALVWQKNYEGLLKEMGDVRKKGLKFEETHVLEIVKTLAAVGNYNLIPQVLKYLPDETLKTPSISPYMQSVATFLVFQNHPLAALEIYKCLPLPSFGPKDDQGLHGRSLIRDCVKASLPSSVICHVAQELVSSGRNPIALHNATEAALQLGKIALATDLLTKMKELNIPLRPHYFWPLVIHSSKLHGEKGVMKVLSTMIAMDVKPDYDTIADYILPYVSFNSPQNLVRKFLDVGLTVSMVLTPMLEILLSTGQVRAASEICELFEGKVETEKLIKPLLKGYLTTLNADLMVDVLQEISKKSKEKEKDWIGKFLFGLVKSRKLLDLSDFTNLVKALQDTKIRISSTAMTMCLNHISQKYDEQVKEDMRHLLCQLTDENFIDESELFMPQMLHPKKMSEPNLRAHLTELEAKGMNTRGVLRQLLQQYSKEGNIAGTKEIVERCQREGIFLSAGMKASIFDMYVKLGELDLAEYSLAELTKTSPNFILDEFKVIDFATLIVRQGKLDRAFSLITEQSKRRHVMGGRSIEMNCKRLLDAVVANGTIEDTSNMFNKLTTLGYCKPTNVILGPLLRAHLENDNLEGAVSEFSRLAQKYRKTPLKHELLCKILLAHGNTDENFILSKNKMLQVVLNLDKKIHGPGNYQVSLIAALAEVGYEKTLRKLFLDPKIKFNVETLMRQCERFADEKKVDVIEVIAKCTKDLRHIAAEEFYDLMLDVYQRDDDCDKALALWYKMQEADVVPSKKFVQNICSMLKANNKNLPPEIISLLDKETRSKILNQ